MSWTANIWLSRFAKTQSSNKGCVTRDVCASEEAFGAGDDEGEENVRENTDVLQR